MELRRRSCQGRRLPECGRRNVSVYNLPKCVLQVVWPHALQSIWMEKTLVEECIRCDEKSHLQRLTLRPDVRVQSRVYEQSFLASRFDAVAG